MGALTQELCDFLDAHPVGVLATTTPGGRPRQSLVYFARAGDRLLISTIRDRRKAEDVRRTGWSSLCVMGHERPYPSAAFSGPTQILTEDIGQPTARLMQRMAAASAAPAPMSDADLAELGRVILAITVERVSAVSYIPPQ